MKKWIVSAWVILVLLVAFFPVEKGLACSGKAEIFNEYNERTGECELDVEVKQLKSLVFTYSKSLSLPLTVMNKANLQPMLLVKQTMGFA